MGWQHQIAMLTAERALQGRLKQPNWDLVARIRTLLMGNDALLHPRYTRQPNSHPLAGHCYVACEAYYHGQNLYGFHGDLTMVPARVKLADGAVHWFLVPQDKERVCILDPTADQFFDTDILVPYARGVRAGFLTKQPSKRAQTVLDWLQAGGGRDASKVYADYPYAKNTLSIQAPIGSIYQYQLNSVYTGGTTIAYPKYFYSTTTI